MKEMFKIGQIRISILGAEEEVTGQQTSGPHCLRVPFPFPAFGQSYCPVSTHCICSQTNSTQRLGKVLGVAVRTTQRKTQNNISK